MTTASNEESFEKVPTWDGNVTHWSQYATDVAWYNSSFLLDKREYVVGRLVQALPDGSAVKTLVQQWRPSQFETRDGATLFLQRLKSSPLMRQPLAEASSLIVRYFGYRRYEGETMGEYVVSESKVHKEYIASMKRLRLEYIARGYTKDQGTAKMWREWHRRHWTGQSHPGSAFDAQVATLHFGATSCGATADSHRFVIPVARRDRWRRGSQQRLAALAGTATVRQAAMPALDFDAADVEAVGPVAFGEHLAACPSPSAPPTTTASSDSETSDEEDESMFYIDLLRGHKLLMNSGLSGRERVGILTATGNRTDYKAITMGLRQQWEDAELRQRDGGTAKCAGTKRIVR